MADLPALHHQRAKAFHGLPSHAASHWVDGKPIFSVDARKVRILAIRGRCWLCGYPLASPGYVVSTETDRNDLYGHLFSQAFGPAHHSCVLYSAAACPFLRYRKSRRRITAHSPRGTATIKGFNRFGVFFPPSPIAFMVFGYWTATETIPLTNQAHLADLYEQAVTDDTATKFTATPRLYWTDAPDDLRRLAAEWSREKQRLQSWAQTSTVTIDRHTYRGHAIDQPPHDQPALIG
ncbi:hypothetical protein [Mycobacterium sp. 852014-52450_SCH5900713]|uniref:hypothetical protein n=1 Tax=Mycobacterium sp. 852014-52450_SCH5900713 TaxID=1834116 RepID=UPI0012E9E139|nr:hypothetical protein [Mycobacterium sp. 852014-52450_SCH5900713]